MTQPGREGPLTIASLVDEVLDSARGYARSQDIVTSLNGDIGATDAAINVADASNLSRGIIEIDDELIRVRSVNQDTGYVEFEPWGRGQSGTDAVAHSNGARITVAPLFSRQRARNAIYATMREIFPDVYAVKTTLVDGNAARPSYIMPTDCYRVLSVHIKNIYDPNLWMPCKRWRTSTTETQTELQILGGIVPGSQTVRIMYMRTPPTELDQTSDLATWGYDYELRDIFIMGGTLRLLQMAEANRVQVQSMEAAGRAEVTPVGASTAMVRWLYQIYQKRVDDERRQLQTRYPAQSHFLR